MDQVYLLLRNSQQSGPYSLEELLALQLTEKDLVRLAGERSGWYYPFEIGLPFTISSKLHKQFLAEHQSPVAEQRPPLAEVKSPVEEPANDIELTIEQLSNKITSIRNNLKFVEEQIHTDKESPAKKAAEKKPRRKISSLYWLLGFAILLLVAAVVLFSMYLYDTRRSDVPLSVHDASTAGEKNDYILQPQTSIVFDSASAPEATVLNDSGGSQQSSILSNGSAGVLLKKATPRKRPVQNKTVEAIEQRVEGTEAQVSNEQLHKSVSLSYVSEEEQRRTLLQKIADLFKKKEEPINSSSNPLSEESIYDKLKMSVATTNYKWLKGVQGLTLTMHNQSSQSVKNAVVNVIYYNRDNSVIEKSTIRFTNVKPYKAQAVAAPDHPWADHAGYEIVAVSAVKK